MSSGFGISTKNHKRTERKGLPQLPLNWTPDQKLMVAFATFGEPYQRPHSWHSRTGGGGAYSISSGSAVRKC
jgi:hypothetical protein